MTVTSVSRSEEEGEESAEGEVGIMSASRSIISPAPPAPAEPYVAGVWARRGGVVVVATGGGRRGEVKRVYRQAVAGGAVGCGALTAMWSTRRLKADAFVLSSGHLPW